MVKLCIFVQSLLFKLEFVMLSMVLKFLRTP